MDEIKIYIPDMNAMMGPNCSGTCGGIYYTAPPQTLKHMSLPSATIPNMIFLNGSALTLGPMWSRAEVLLANDMVFFKKGILERLPEYRNGKANYTIILHSDFIYHYCVKVISSPGGIYQIDNDNGKIRATLLSKMKK